MTDDASDILALLKRLDRLMTEIASAQLVLQEYVARQPGFDRQRFREVRAAVQVKVGRTVAGESSPSLETLIAMLIGDPGAPQ